MPDAMPKIMLVGQAPASAVRSKGGPFSGQAGRVLFSWLARAGFAEEEFRARCYFTAITKCFPGPAKGGPGRGDRAPGLVEQAMCRPFLERELALIAPELILTVGRLAMTCFLGKVDFSETIGQRFDVDGRCIIPLPHPSGVSRWTNAPANRARLDLALAHLRDAMR
jgi:uracil-DNA glycosylase family 4